MRQKSNESRLQEAAADQETPTDGRGGVEHVEAEAHRGRAQEAEEKRQAEAEGQFHLHPDRRVCSVEIPHLQGEAAEEEKRRREEIGEGRRASGSRGARASESRQSG